MISSNKFDIAKKEYNKICYDIGREDLTIGIDDSVDGKTDKWNLRDLVSEIDYQHSTYSEYGHMNCELLHSSDSYYRLKAMRECKALKHFVEKYSRYIDNLTCYEEHCSKFDNKRRK